MLKVAEVHTGQPPVLMPGSYDARFVRGMRAATQRGGSIILVDRESLTWAILTIDGAQPDLLELLDVDISTLKEGQTLDS